MSLADLDVPSARRLLEAQITRRSLLGGASFAVFAAAAAACGFGTSSSGQSKYPDIKTGTQIYRRPNILQIGDFTNALARYTQQYGRNAIVDFTSSDYPAVTETQMLGGARFDVVEEDSALGSWYSAGLLQSLEGLPGLDALKADMFPAAISDMTARDGHLVGLPYFSQVHGFYYNAELFDQANVKAPQTWDELVDVARTIKSRGIAPTPLAPAWRRDFSGGANTLVTMAYAEGMQAMFDHNLKPTYDSDPVMLQALKTCKTLYDEKLVPPDAMTYGLTDAMTAFTSQKAAMFQFTSYWGARINLKPSPIAGKVKIALMPGKTHRVWATTSGHVMPTGALDREEAWHLLSFISGTDKTGIYYMPKNLYGLTLGLVVPYKTVNTDPDVQKFRSTWVDVGIYNQQTSDLAVSIGPAFNAPWYSQWVDQFIIQMQKAIGGSVDPQSALKASADFVRAQKK